MHKTITSDRLAVYQKYTGDEDAWLRINLLKENAIFGDDLTGQSEIWILIGSVIQDIHLIRRGLVSSTYKQNVIENLHSVCDDESFAVLTKEIHCLSDPT